MGSHGERLGFMKPQEPILVEVAPISDAWLHEIKHDGFRTRLVLDWAGGRAFTKAGHDWSRRYWPIVAALEKQPAKALILDGEMIAPGTDGLPNFHEITRASPGTPNCSRSSRSTACTGTARICARCRRSIARRWELVRPADGIIQYSQHVEGGGLAF